MRNLQFQFFRNLVEEFIFVLDLKNVFKIQVLLLVLNFENVAEIWFPSTSSFNFWQETAHISRLWLLFKWMASHTSRCTLESFVCRHWDEHGVVNVLACLLRTKQEHPWLTVTAWDLENFLSYSVYSAYGQVLVWFQICHFALLEFVPVWFCAPYFLVLHHLVKIGSLSCVSYLTVLMNLQTEKSKQSCNRVTFRLCSVLAFATLLSWSVSCSHRSAVLLRWSHKCK